MNFLAELRSRLKVALAKADLPVDDYWQMLQPATDAKFGDFQANCAMPIAKATGQNPRVVSQNLVAHLKVEDLCEAPEIAGPGFINLRLKGERLEAETGRLARDPLLGVEPATKPKTVIVDFSGPNVAKPMHVGHLRSTVIGNALCKTLKSLGHKVISDNHVGDWGTQFGMIIYGYKHFRNEAAYEQNAVAELARLYRLVNQLSDYHDLVKNRGAVLAKVEETRRSLASAKGTAIPNEKPADAAKRVRKAEGDLADAEEEAASLVRKIGAVEESPELLSMAKGHPQIAELARKETAKLHAGDKENLRLWQKFVPLCLAALDGIYERFGISFDLTLGESHYNPQLPGVVERLKKAGLAVESEGAVCVFVEGNKAPFIIQKADGAYTYATTDIATIIDRIEEKKADTILYVVDARQSEHFGLLFETSRRLGYATTDFRHTSFGTILGEDKRPFKTRSGDTVGLESLLDEAIARARQIVDENDNAKPVPELDEEERQRVATIVGMGGIIYADLHHNRDSDYVFSWEKMLATRGDTATYIQYAYARVQGIFRKGGIDLAQLRDTTNLSELPLRMPQERALALQLHKLGSTVQDVCVDYRPNLLTQYLFETANAFSAFFEHCPVLKEEDSSVRTARLLLCDLTARVMKRGLELLGIEVAEQM